TVSAPSAVRFDEGAIVYALRGWNNRHGRFYAPETLKSRVLSCPGFEFTVLRLAGVERIPRVYARWALVGRRSTPSPSSRAAARRTRARPSAPGTPPRTAATHWQATPAAGTPCRKCAHAIPSRPAALPALPTRSR